jgi:putative membrane protein
MLFSWILVFHLIGLVLWVGGLLAVTQVLIFHSQEASPEARAALGRLEARLLNRLAHPGAALVLIAGPWLVLTNTAYYLHAGWFHAKLILVVVLAGLDWLACRRTRALVTAQAPIERRQGLVLHIAIGSVFVALLVLVLLKPF